MTIDKLKKHKAALESDLYQLQRSVDGTNGALKIVNLMIEEEEAILAEEELVKNQKIDE